MTYKLGLPDGRVVTVDDDVTVEQARLMIVRQFPDLFKRPQGFGPAMGAGWDAAARGIETFGADIAGKLGLDGLSSGLRGLADKNTKEIEAGFDPTTQEDVDAAWKRGIGSGIGALTRKYVTEPTGGMVGALGPSAAGAAAGAVSPVPGGAMTGFSVPFFAQSAGENQLRQREASPGVDPNMLASTVTALAQTALGTFGFGRMVHGAMGSQIAEREAMALAPKVLSGEMTKEAAVRSIGSTMRNVLAETTASAGINIGTGVADEALRRAQAGQPLGDKNALDTYKDVAIAGGVLAPVFGVAHGSGARGRAVGKLSDAERTHNEKINAAERQRVADENDAKAAQEYTDAPQPVVAADPQQAAAALKEQIADGARRAVEQRDQPGVLDQQHPLQMEPTDGLARRADAAAAFEGAVVEDDLLGGVAKPAPVEVPTPERRAAAPEADPAQAALPLSSEYPPPLELTPPPAEVGLDPRLKSRAGDARLSSREDFAGVVYPQSPTWKRGSLDGHDLTTPEGVGMLQKVLRAYNKNLEDSEKNAPRKAALDAKIDELEVLRQQLTAQGKLPLEGPKDAAAAVVDAFVHRSPDVSAKEPINDNQPDRHADGAPAVEHLGQRDQQQAVPAGLPDAVGRADGRGDEPAAAGVRPEGQDARPLTPLQERAKFGRDSGAVVDAGGNYLKSRQSIKLGKAMEAGDFEGVVSALADSKNVFIRHVAEAVAKLEDIKVKVSDDAELQKIDRTVKQDTDNARILQSQYEAMRKYADEVRETGKIPDAFWREPVPLMEDHPDFYHPADTGSGVALKYADVFGQHNNWMTKPEEWVKEFDSVKEWNARNGGDERIRDFINNKIERTGAAGTFDPKTNTATAQPHKARDEHTVAHEMVHALVHTAIDSPTKDQKYFVDKLKQLHAYVRGVMKEHKYDGDGKYSEVVAQDYGLTDVHEFVSEAMTNPDFQQKLSKIKYQNTTAWGRFTEFVAKLLGLKNDNAFTEFLANYEGLEKADGGLKGGTSDAPVKLLGDYADAAKPEVPKGKLGAVINSSAEQVRDKGVKGALGGIKDNIIQGVFDDKHGITKHLLRAWTRATATGREATARALLQASTYAPQMARESLSIGYVKKNAEGFWKLQADDNNLRAYLDAVKALPTDTDKMQVANGILTNLAYHEREQLLANKKAGAVALEAEARKELKEASKMTGRSAAVKYRSGKAKLDMAKDLQEQEYARPASVTDASIAQALADAKTPDVKKMLDIVRAINHQNIDMLVEGGKITQETADLWKQKDHYVPLQRMMEDDDRTPMMPLAQGGARTRDIKSFKGSGREVNDITENLIKQRMYVVDTAMRNNAFRKAIEELELETGNPAGVKYLGTKPHHNTRGSIPAIMVDGEKHYYSVEDPTAFHTFQGIMQEAPEFVNALESVTKFFREAVMLSPDAIMRNLVRDTTEVWNFGASDKSFAGVVGRVFSQFAKSMPGVVKEGFGNKIHQPHYNVQKFGITGAKEFTSLDAERMAIVREQLKRTGVRDWGATADGIITNMSRLIKPLQNAAAEGELAPREHVFKEVLARTGSETEAAMAAINTLDFRRRGAWQGITIAKKLIPFFNSQLQGWYKIATALSGDNLSSGHQDRKAAMRVLYTKAAKMAATAWLYQTLMQDDEDYMEVKKEIRDTNILIPAGTDDSGKTLFMRLPLPFEFGSMFWTLPANINAYYSGKQNGHEFVAATKAAAYRAMPGIMPQAVKPAIENAANYSFFAGRPLENAGVARIEEGQRAYSTTSEVAKAAGEVSGYSPIKIDNFMRGYLGSLGVAGIQLVDKLFLEDSSDPDTAVHRAPILRSIIVDPLSSASRDKFYEIKERVEKVHSTANELAKTKGAEDARAYLAKETGGVPNKTLFDMYKGVQTLDKDVTKAMQAEKAVKASKDSPEMKRARLEHIRKVTNAKLQKAMPNLRSYMEKEVDASVPEDDDEE